MQLKALNIVIFVHFDHPPKRQSSNVSLWVWSTV